MNQITKLLNWKTAAMLVLIVLVGCATGQKQYHEGLTLLDQGKTKQGLAKLQEAVKADPDNMGYRVTLSRRREQAINQALMNGFNERAAGHPDAAKAEYEKVLEIDQHNGRAKDGIASLEMDKRHMAALAHARELLQKDKLEEARDVLKPVLLENPDNDEALELRRRINDLIAKQQTAGPELSSQFKKPVTLEFRDASLKMVFEALSRTSGINILLDKDVRPDLKTSIFVKGVSVEDTIDLILMQNDLEKKIINDNTVFVYPDSLQKNKDYQELKVRSFHLVNADAKQMESMIKTLLKTKDIFINEKTNSVVIRDTPAAIRLAEKMIADQDVPDPEVMLEVEVLEVTQSRLSQLGIAWPNKLTLTATGAGQTPTLTELRRINSNSILTSPAMSLTLDAMLQDTDTNILANPRIRARNHEKARIMIGDRVPVITNAVTPVSTGTPVVTGSVQYLDVGLKLEVEPDIHPDNEVAIKINLEVSNIAKEVPNAVSGTLAYQVGTRNASTLLQLKDGETQILAGLIDNEDRKTANKVPGLGDFPVLGRLFSTHGDNKTKTEIVLSITPHIVGRTRLPEAEQTEYWSGTEQTLRDRRFLLKPAVPATGASGAALSAPPSPALLPAPAPAASPAVQPVAPPSKPPLALSWVGPNAVKVGDRVILTLNAQAAQSMSNLGLQVNFDPAVLKVVDVSEGNLLRQSNVPSTFTKSVDQNKGLASVELAGTGKDGASGNGSVVTIMFQATGTAQQSQIMLSQIAPKGSDGKELAYAAPEPYQLAVSK